MAIHFPPARLPPYRTCSGSLWHTHTFPVRRSLTLEAPKTGPHFLCSPLVRLGSDEPSPGHLDWEKYQNIFWEKFPPPTQHFKIHSRTKVLVFFAEYGHSQEWSLHRFMRVTVREGSLTHREQQSRKTESLSLWWHHRPRKLLLHKIIHVLIVSANFSWLC